jgi:adenylate cyclase
MAIDEEGTHARLKALRREFIEPTTAEHRGRIVKLTGDGALVEFPSVVDAVTCAVAVQNGVAERQTDVAEDQRIRFRIGINIGDVIIEDDDIYGDGVNVAARLEALAEPGGICVSRTVYNHARNKVDFGFEPLGEHKVKNIPEPVTVYRVFTGVDPAVPRKPRRSARWLAMGAAAAGAVAIGLTLWLEPWHLTVARWGRHATPSLPDKPSIAVLPFDNLSNHREEEYFANGLTDDLITDLSKISGLFVIARNSVFTYKDPPADLREVARELGVRYVLEGSVRRAGENVRINAQLIDSETGGHVWADRFDRRASDIFAVQDEVIRHIVDALAVQLSASEQQRLERLPTTNLEAYDYYLRAEQAARTGFRPQVNEALRLYRTATTLDPTFAEAFAAAARTAAYVMRNNYNDVLPAPLARTQAYEDASRALELDPEAPLPFSILAVLQVVDGRHEEALASAERAVLLGPSDAGAYTALALVLTFSGRHADAVAAIKTAMRLNPSLPPGARIDAGMAYLLNDDPEGAIEILERARAEAPNVDDIHAMLTAAYAQAGRLDAARRAAAEAVRLSPNLCVEINRVVLGNFRDDQDLTKILDAMRTGGLPQWPYGFSGDARDRLSPPDISRLAFGQTWQGRVEGSGPALSQIQPDGNMAFRTTTHIATGAAFVVGDMLCERIEALSLGRPVCGPVYRLSEPSGEDDLAYVYVNASKVFYFSPVE